MEDCRALLLVRTIVEVQLLRDRHTVIGRMANCFCSIHISSEVIDIDYKKTMVEFNVQVMLLFLSQARHTLA